MPEQARTFRPRQQVVVDGPQGPCQGIVVSASHRTGQYAVHIAGVGNFDYHWSQMRPDDTPEPQHEQLTFATDEQLARRLIMCEHTLAAMEAGIPSLRREINAVRLLAFPKYRQLTDPPADRTAA